MRPDYYKVKVRAKIEGFPTKTEAEIECFDLIDSLGLDFYLGNTLKYLWRAGRKTASPLDDIKKAATYLNQAVERRS